MDGRELLGRYVPGSTLWHRLGVGPKYLVFIALTLPPLLSSDLRVALVMLALAAAAVGSTGAPAGWAWGVPWGYVVVLGIILGYHLVAGHPEVGAATVATLTTALYSSRVVLLTTPVPVLVDALVASVRPLRRLGLDPERFGLAVAVMIRSIPYLAGAFGDVRDAARARGLERNALAAVAPVVVEAVAYARRTGDALAARGLGEDATPDHP